MTGEELKTPPTGRVRATKKKRSFEPSAFLATTGIGRSLARFPKGQVLYSQGEPADAVFYVQTGKVKVAVISEQGKEAVVAVLGPDEFCGEGCLAGQPRRTRHRLGDD